MRSDSKYLQNGRFLETFYGFLLNERATIENVFFLLKFLLQAPFANARKINGARKVLMKSPY
jgi:hypothetical protein